MRIALVLLLWIATPLVARAQAEEALPPIPPPPPAAPAPPPAPAEEELGMQLGVSAILGFGTPVGFGGVEVDVSPIPELSIAIGAGLGGLPGDGAPQLGTMMRLAPWRDVYAGLGSSMGRYGAHDLISGGTRYRWERAYWLNAELGWFAQAQDGLFGRVFLGFSRVLNPGACDGYCEMGNRDEVLPFLGGSIGYHFEP